MVRNTLPRPKNAQKLFRKCFLTIFCKISSKKTRPSIHTLKHLKKGGSLNCGINLSLRFFPPEYDSPIPPIPYVDFEVEPGKVHFIAPLIFNGVCINVKGYINLSKLDGSARIIYDPDRAAVEDEKENNAPEPPEGHANIDNNEKTGKDRTPPKDRTVTLPNGFTAGSNVSTTTPNFNQPPSTNNPPSTLSENNNNPFASGLTFSQQLSNSMSQLGGYSPLGLAGLASGGVVPHGGVGGIGNLHQIGLTNVGVNSSQNVNMSNLGVGTQMSNLGVVGGMLTPTGVTTGQHNFMSGAGTGIMSTAGLGINNTGIGGVGGVLSSVSSLQNVNAANISSLTAINPTVLAGTLSSQNLNTATTGTSSNLPAMNQLTSMPQGPLGSRLCLPSISKYGVGPSNNGMSPNNAISNIITSSSTANISNYNNNSTINNQSSSVNLSHLPGLGTSTSNDINTVNQVLTSTEQMGNGTTNNSSSSTSLSQGLSHNNHGWF